jgi:hypothetical protein
MSEEKYDHQSITMSSSQQSSSSLFQQSSRRDQDGLNPVEALRLGILGGKNKKNSDSDSDDDRKGLVDH